MKTSKNLQVLTRKDTVLLVFGEWFDKVNGNTYYDVELKINDTWHNVAYQYGYNATDKESIDKALSEVGYRVRNNKRDHHAPYKALKLFKGNKLKRELFKVTEQTR